MGMNRVALLEVLARHLTDEIVVSSYSTATDWHAIGDRPLNYFGHGAMGLCSSHGLGLAIARPERTVVVLDGDGSLLMNLGTLVTLAAHAPANLLHMVLQNGTYEANGGHPIVNMDVDFAAIARGAGLANVETIEDLEIFERRIPSLLRGEWPERGPGPAFVVLPIDQGPLGPRSYTELYRPERRAALRRELDRESPA